MSQLVANFSTYHKLPFVFEFIHKDVCIGTLILGEIVSYQYCKILELPRQPKIQNDLLLLLASLLERWLVRDVNFLNNFEIALMEDLQLISPRDVE